MVDETKSGLKQDEAANKVNKDEPTSDAPKTSSEATVNTHLSWDSIKTSWGEYKQKVGL